ncbi:MAG: cell division protein FtsQ [Clostridiales bacterium]|nr:cell division protein FtsQ [Clostridiales bacterium]
MTEQALEKKRTGPVLAAVAVLLLAIILLSVNVKEITVTGNERYTEQEMVDLVFPDHISRNCAWCYLRDHFGTHETIPFVEDYSLVFHGPRQVEIIVYEKTVVGYVSPMSNSYMYFDKDGIVVESSSQRLQGVPQITGLDFGYIVLYQKIPVADETVFQEILNLTQILYIYGMNVDRIQYDSFGEATLYIGEVEVTLGSNDNLNGKIAELGDMLPLLEGRRGTLHLEDYDDTNTTAGYSFQPKG